MTGAAGAWWVWARYSVGGAGTITWSSSSTAPASVSTGVGAISPGRAGRKTDGLAGRAGDVGVIGRDVRGRAGAGARGTCGTDEGGRAAGVDGTPGVGARLAGAGGAPAPGGRGTAPAGRVGTGMDA